MPDLPLDTDEIVARALREDLGSEGDVTSRASLPAGLVSRARVEGRAAGVVAGLPVAARVAAAVDGRLRFDPRIGDGEALEPGTVLATVEGPAGSVMAA